jgi:tRNA pseudouridine38-40 synthase
MVRNIAGTLVKMGKGHLGNTSMQEILNKKDRCAAGMTAPAYGLCLDWVDYDGRGEL